MSKYYTKETRRISSTGRDIRIVIYRPVKEKKERERAPGVLWIHGGGYMNGFPEMLHFTRGISLVKKFGAVVVAPAYRLVWEAPYPAAVEDCYAALKYMKDHAEELGINSSQIMVGGESAGGGLTAGLCIYARDKGEVNIAFQMPLYPMLDNHDTESSKRNFDPIWNTYMNHYAWKKYLGKLWNTDKVPPYASPSRLTDCSDLPPAYTFVGDRELFYKETVDYVEKLKESGVDAKVDVYHNWFHAYDAYMPLSRKRKMAVERFEKEFAYAAENYFREQREGSAITEE